MSRQSKYYNITSIIGIPTPSVNLNELNMVQENYSECIRSFRNNLIAFCKEDNQPYIDFGINMNSSHFLNDGLHPNIKGHRIMANNATLELSKIIDIL